MACKLDFGQFKFGPSFRDRFWSYISLGYDDNVKVRRKVLDTVVCDVSVGDAEPLELSREMANRRIRYEAPGFNGERHQISGQIFDGIF